MLTALLLTASILMPASQTPDCADAAACRQAALEAAEQKNYEAFHDLAWRAVQKGRRNDPGLMLLLARAQSLSGRPGDALVMLRRLAGAGDASEAIESDDFRRVRALPGWPDVEAAIVAAREKRAAAPETAARAADMPSKSPAARTSLPSGSVEKRSTSPRSEAPKAAAAAGVATARDSAGEEAIRLPGFSIDAIGLAYDQVSKRFVVGDRRQNRLIVADEVFKHVNDLIGSGSGGFGSLTAVEIDRRRGDLWVTSAGQNGSASIHKLQLVSGRVLARIDVPEDALPATLNDISISESGAILFADGAGSRLLAIDGSGQELARAVQLRVFAPSSIAASGGMVFVAHDGGLSVLDLKSRSVSEVRAAKGVVLNGLRRIRWHNGSLVAIQADEKGGTARLVRIRIARTGRTATRLEVLDDQSPEEGSALTIAASHAYYLARTDEGPTIRRVPLR